MKIAVLSGKGGTGKTLVAVNLAAVAPTSIYMDCDVEEPNGHLFFKPRDTVEQSVTVPIPQVHDALCNGCRKCVDFCQYNALAYIKDRVVVFDDICHSCGGCTLLCPEKALKERQKTIGSIQTGIFEQVTVCTGILNPGEASGTPIIKKLGEEVQAQASRLTFIDCPPGSACIVMDSIKDADYCILVAEPTIFGVHNLNMVYELVKLFNKPFGVVLNKCLPEDNPAEQFCREKNIKMLARIPFDYELGMLNSNAEIVALRNKKYRTLFTDLLATVREEAGHETIADTQR